MSLVAATSLSDIVCSLHVAGCCIETTSDPVRRLVLDNPEIWPKLDDWRYYKPQSPSFGLALNVPLKRRRTNFQLVENHACSVLIAQSASNNPMNSRAG